MNETKKVFKWWWGWNPGKIEKWLEEEEGKGWNLTAILGIGTSFLFEKGEARRLAYRIDYQPQAQGDYQQLFQDAGWILVAEINGWYFWKQSYTDIKPELFTDVESLMARNQRLMLLMIPAFLPFIGLFLIIISLMTTSVMTSTKLFFFIPVTLLICFIMGFFIGVMSKIIKANQDLLKEKNNHRIEK